MQKVWGTEPGCQGSGAFSSHASFATQLQNWLGTALGGK